MFRKQKQRLFGKQKTVDEAFEGLRDQFRDYLKQLGQIEKDLARFQSNLTGLASALLEVSQGFSPLFESSAGSLATEDGSGDLAVATNIFSASSDEMASRLASLSAEVAGVRSVGDSLKADTKKRDDALLLYDAAQESLQSLQDKGGAPAKVTEAEAELRRSKAEYESLNADVGQRILDVLADRQAVLDRLLRTLVTLQVNMFQEAQAAFGAMAVRDGRPPDSSLQQARPISPAGPTSPPAAKAKPQRSAAAAPTAAPSVAAASRWELEEEEGAAPPPVPRKSMQLPHGVGTAATSAASAAPPPSLPKKKAGGSRATSAAFDPFASEEFDTLAANALASRAQDEQAQQRAGAAVASSMQDAGTRARLGNAVAANTSNPLAASVARNEKAQAVGGKVIGAAATNRTVQKKVASELKSNPDARKKAFTLAKKGM
mmetsp:Transcript_235/g.735  ORF Transcript_235/g.735 Transcript_235/m.735 type:complete len:432 (-) Transcript_235:1344-2639(-)